MIFLISLGLYSSKDISLGAVEAARKCDRLYIERYTSYYKTTNKELENLFGKKIQEITREEMEDGKKILAEAKNKDIGIMVVGDALSATTHASLLLEAKKLGIKTRVIHGSSILTAVGETGLSLYKFGKTTSIPFTNDNVEEPYNVIKNNKGLHTLILLDLDPKNNKYMTTQEAIKYLLGVEKKRKEKVFNPDTKVVAVSGLGNDSVMRFGRVRDVMDIKLKGLPQCLVVVGKTHFFEEEYLNMLV